MKNNSIIHLSVFLLLIITGCKSKQESPNANTSAASELKMTPFAPSTPFPHAAITSMDYQSGDFTFTLQGLFQLGEQTPDVAQKMCANSAQGQHIHLIVDNKPYEAKYQEKFHYKIEDGEHYILAFLSRSYHESIKTPTASALVKATVQDSSFKRIDPVTEPMLFYSRPKGVYVGADTKKIMLDFYLGNCILGNTQYKVKATINGKDFMIDTWQPYYLEGLPMGDNKIILTLINSSGEIVKSPLNPVERSFKLQAEPGK